MIKKNRETDFELSEIDKVATKIVKSISLPACIYLHGQLGAGKTTLCAALIRALGVNENVTSPTYNLIQEYRADAIVIYHLDLYRLDDPEEIEYLAISDLLGSNVLFLIEWPEKGAGWLPPATHELWLSMMNQTSNNSLSDSSISGTSRKLILQSV